MKYILAVLIMFAVCSVQADTDVKKICHDVRVKNKLVHQCKNVKIHKKFEGTPIPTK